MCGCKWKRDEEGGMGVGVERNTKEEESVQDE